MRSAEVVAVLGSVVALVVQLAFDVDGIDPEAYEEIHDLVADTSLDYCRTAYQENQD